MAEMEQQQEPKKSSKFVIIIALVVLLVAGGVAVYFFIAGDSDGEDTEEVEVVDEEQDLYDNKESIFYDIPTPFIVNYAKGSAARLLQISVSLLVKEEDTVEALKKHEPMIRNNVLMLLSSQDPAELQTLDGKQIIRAKILQEIIKIMEKMTEKNNVKELYFTSFVMQ